MTNFAVAPIIAPMKRFLCFLLALLLAAGSACASPLGAPSGEAVPFGYFDDAVFIGDSVTRKLYIYIREQRANDPAFMGGVHFLTAVSLGSGNALRPVTEQSAHPLCKGKKRPLEESVLELGARKVYVMLGMNDLVTYTPQEAARNLETLLDRILVLNPQARIFVQSATPRMEGVYDGCTNEALFAYDQLLYELCQRRGFDFIDVAWAMRDETGCLPAAYCGDPDGMRLHFSDEACAVWVDYLRTHVPEDLR